LQAGGRRFDPVWLHQANLKFKIWSGVTVDRAMTLRER
jgi:hypothetical protein